MTHPELEADINTNCDIPNRKDLIRALKSKINREVQEAKTELWELLSYVKQSDMVYANNIIDQLSFLNALEAWVAPE